MLEKHRLNLNGVIHNIFIKCKHMRDISLLLNGTLISDFKLICIKEHNYYLYVYNFKPTQRIDFSRIDNAPFSGARRAGERRRRRFLSLDEVLERRKELKERKARHWERKNSRLNKSYSGLIPIDS
jgi:hypothetical protein